MKLTKLEILMACSVPLIWGMGMVFAKSAIADFPPILLMSLRFTLTALLLVWFVPIPRKNLVALFFISIIAAAIQYSLTFTGLKSLDAGVAALIVQLEVPFLVMLGALLLNEKPSRRKWIGIAIAFVGVGLIANQISANDDKGTSWFPMLLVVGGALSWAIGQVYIRKLEDISGLAVTAWVAVFASIQLAFMSLLFESDQIEAIQNANWIVWSVVVYLGVIMTAVGYLIWNTLIRKHDVGRVGPYLLLLPVFALIGGMIFLNESLSFYKLLGGAIVILGVALVSIEKSAD